MGGSGTPRALLQVAVESAESGQSLRGNGYLSTKDVSGAFPLSFTSAVHLSSRGENVLTKDVRGVRCSLAPRCPCCAVCHGGGAARNRPCRLVCAFSRRQLHPNRTLCHTGCGERRAEGLRAAGRERRQKGGNQGAARAAAGGTAGWVGRGARGGGGAARAGGGRRRPPLLLLILRDGTAAPGSKERCPAWGGSQVGRTAVGGSRRSRQQLAAATRCRLLRLLPPHTHYGPCPAGYFACIVGKRSEAHAAAVDRAYPAGRLLRLSAADLEGAAPAGMAGADALQASARAVAVALPLPLPLLPPLLPVGARLLCSLPRAAAVAGGTAGKAWHALPPPCCCRKRQRACCGA